MSMREDGRSGVCNAICGELMRDSGDGRGKCAYRSLLGVPLG